MKTSGTNRRTVRNLDSVCKEHTRIHLLTPKTRRRKQAETARGFQPMSNKAQCEPQPEMSTRSSPSCPLANLQGGVGLPQLRGVCSCVNGVSTDPACHLKGAGVATAGTCGGSIGEAGQSSDWGQEFHSPGPCLHQLPATSPHLQGKVAESEAHP